MKARTVNDVISAFKKRLASLSSPLASFAPYSNVYALFRSVASVLTEQDTRLLNVVDESFLSTATGKNLDRRAEDFGFYRRPGSKAKGSIIINSGRPASIKRGSILLNASNSLQYEVLQDINVKVGESYGKVSSVGQGSINNLPAGTRLYSAVYDLEITVGYSRDSLTGNAVGNLSGGASQETDEEFRRRVVGSIRRDGSYLGSTSYIKEEILKLPYITKVFIYNHKPVPGYFSIFVDTRDSKNIDGVYALVDSIKPVGSLPLVKSLKLSPVSIRVECSDVAEKDTQSVKDLITEAISEYVENLLPGQSLSASRLRDICRLVHPGSSVTQPMSDIMVDDESLISVFSIRVMI